MDADGDWAPPAARDARLLDPDLELARRFSRVPSSRGRALLLGLNWDALLAARRRLVICAAIISGVLALAILSPTLAPQLNGTPANGVVDPRFYILSIALGGVFAYFARLFAGVLSRRFVRDPAKHGTWEQHWMVEPAVEALWFSGLVGAALFFTIGHFEDLGLVAGCAVASLLPLRSVSRLPVLIQRSYVTTVPTFLELAKLSPSESLLGYRVRWLVANHLAVTVAAVSLPLAALQDWWLIIPAAGVLAVFGTVAAKATLNGHPRLSVTIRLVAAAILATAAIQFLVSPAGQRFLG